jgi:hypothetical protein
MGFGSEQKNRVRAWLKGGLVFAVLGVLSFLFVLEQPKLLKRLGIHFESPARVPKPGESITLPFFDERATMTIPRHELRKPVRDPAHFPPPPDMKEVYFPYYAHFYRNFRFIILNSGKKPARLTFYYMEPGTHKPHPTDNGLTATVAPETQSEFFEDPGKGKKWNIRVVSDEPVKFWLCEPTTYGGQVLYCRTGFKTLPQQAESTKRLRHMTPLEEYRNRREVRQFARHLRQWADPKGFEKSEEDREQAVKKLLAAIPAKGRK